MALSYVYPMSYPTSSPYVDSIGNKRQVYVEITLDSSYVAGGIPLTPATFGLARVDYGDVAVKTAAGTGPGGGVIDVVSAGTSPYAPKLKLMNAGATGELANGAASGAVLGITLAGE